MLTLIIGGSGSGKSAYAEDYICGKAVNNPKYYIATMKVTDDETLKRIEKHRDMRKDKGFETIEKSEDIEEAIIFIAVKNSYALLECMSNLVANETFSGKKVISKEIVEEKVISGIEKLVNNVNHLVVVSNNIFEDGIDYDPMTKDYIEALGRINQRLASMAEEVFEVVVGIPVKIK